MSDRRAMTPEDVAERWGCSASHVRRLINNGALPAFRLGGKLLRIRPADVEAYECPTIDCNASVAVGPSQNIETESASRVVGLTQAMRQMTNEELNALAAELESFAFDPFTNQTADAAASAIRQLMRERDEARELLRRVTVAACESETGRTDEHFGAVDDALKFLQAEGQKWDAS